MIQNRIIDDMNENRNIRPPLINFLITRIPLFFQILSKFNNSSKNWQRLEDIRLLLLDNKGKKYPNYNSN